jgi:DnaK suppressor protein
MVAIGKDLLEKLKRELEKRQEELAQKEERLVGEDPLRDPDRLTENAPDDDSREVVGHDRVRALLAEIEIQQEETQLALKKIAQGSYGVCQECGQAIEKSRLELMPWALLCIKCERKEEA